MKVSKYLLRINFIWGEKRIGTRINNHLRTGYSDYNLLFLKRYSSEVNNTNKILDVGAGHYRNLYLFYKLGFKKLYAIDKNIPEPLFNIKVDFILRNIESGLPYKNKEFEIVLCNFVLMFIEPEKLSFVIEELLRVCGKFLIIETYKKKISSIKTEYKNYDFTFISEYIENSIEFEILDKKNYYEKLIARRIVNDKR